MWLFFRYFYLMVFCFFSSSDSSPIVATVLFFCWLGSSCFDFYGNKYILPRNCCSVVFRLVAPFLFLPLIRERHKCQMSQRKGSNDLLSSRWWIAFSRLEGFWCGSVICDLWLLLLWRPKKKCRFIYVCHRRDLFQNSCKGQWRCWPFNNLKNVQITFPLMTLSWYYHIFDKKENQMTRCWIISEMYLLFWHGDIGNFKAQVSELKKSWFTHGAIYHVQLFMYWRLCSQLMKKRIL